MPIANTPGLDIYYETCGSGDPLLLIMGFGSTHHWWKWQVDELKDHFQVIQFDNRGVGKTQLPKKEWTLSDMAADAMALLDHLGIDSAHVMGASMGGMISQYIALEHPTRVRKLILACTTPAMGHKPPDPAVLAKLMPRPGLPREQIARESLDILFVPEFIEREKALVDEVLGVSLANMAPVRGLMGQMNAIMAHDTRHRLKDIFHDTLVITGADDVLIPPEHSDLLAGSIPKAKLVKLPKAGHGFFVEAARPANRHVIGFLKDS